MMIRIASGLMAGAVVFSLSSAAHGEVKTEKVRYTHGKEDLEAYVAYDDSVKGKRPGVLVVPDAGTAGQVALVRARRLAGLGYVAWAVDTDARDRRPVARVRTLRRDRRGMGARARAGLERLGRHKLVDADKLAAVGYGLGGTCVLDLARGGADLAAAVSFHPALDAPAPAEAGKVRAKVLVLRGAEDARVTARQVAAFQKEMRKAKADWQMVTYGGAGAGFADPGEAGSFRPKAAHRAWQAMRLFLAETIGPPGRGGTGQAIGRFAKDKIAKPVAGAGKTTGKAVSGAAGWTWRKITGKNKDEGERDRPDHARREKEEDEDEEEEDD